jgi:LmbE family N-acetylglucosaminyl deacetylase
MQWSAPQPRLSDPPSGSRGLVIAAHPDDIESWCGGTVARLIDAGMVVEYLLLTSGDKGSDNPDFSPEQVGALREAEQEAAARQLGVRQVTFLRHPDGGLTDAVEVRERIVRCLRRIRPDVVFTHDPERPFPPYVTHRDHRIAGRVALDAIYPDARDQRSFPEHAAEGLEPHVVRQVWLFSSSTPDTWIDISDGFDRKIAARLAHVSQTTDAGALRTSWRERAAAIGTPLGVGLAEAFVVLHLE